MTLDEIMEKEKFNEVEKELVNHLLSREDRVKVISEIKIAKSNDRQSEKVLVLTFVILLISGLGIFIEFIDGLSLEWPYNLIAVIPFAFIFIRTASYVYKKNY